MELYKIFQVLGSYVFMALIFFTVATTSQKSERAMLYSLVWPISIIGFFIYAIFASAKAKKEEYATTYGEWHLGKKN